MHSVVFKCNSFTYVVIALSTCTSTSISGCKNLCTVMNRYHTTGPDQPKSVDRAINDIHKGSEAMLLQCTHGSVIQKLSQL